MTCVALVMHDYWKCVQVTLLYKTNSILIVCRYQFEISPSVHTLSLFWSYKENLEMKYSDTLIEPGSGQAKFWNFFYVKPTKFGVANTEKQSLYRNYQARQRHELCTRHNSSCSETDDQSECSNVITFTKCVETDSKLNLELRLRKLYTRVLGLWMKTADWRSRHSWLNLEHKATWILINLLNYSIPCLIQPTASLLVVCMWAVV